MPKRSLLLIAFAALIGSVLLLPGCGTGDDDDDSAGASDPSLIWSEDFENEESVLSSGAIINADDPASAFAPGYSGNAFWLGDGNSLSVPAAGKIPQTDGTIEFRILPKASWINGKTLELLSIGGAENFALTKDSQKDFLNFIVHGAALPFAENNDLITYYGFTIRLPFLWASGWAHVAIVWKNLGVHSSEGYRRIYLNGVMMNEVKGYLPTFTVDQSLLIGPSSSDRQPECLIDEMRVYNRAKTSAEISSEAHNRTVNLPYQLDIVPMPQPYGVRPENGFQVNAGTKIVVSQEWKDRLEDLIATLQDAIESNTGFRPEAVSSSAFNGSDNAIAIGAPSNNWLIGRYAEQRKLPTAEGDAARDAYTIEVYEDGIAVMGAQYSAAVYGLTSLIRMAEQFRDGAIPPVTVVDRPDFAIRGTEMPGTNGELTEELARRIRYMSELKLTHILLPGDFYFDLDNDYVRENAQELFQFVRDHGMEPVPQIQLYGHAGRVIAECNRYGLDCAEGDSTDTCPLVEEMYEQVYRPLFTNIAQVLDPRWIHITHDEIMTFNKNPACKSAGLSRAQLYAHSVNTTVDLVREVMPSAQIMIWADMILPGHHEAWLEGTMEIPTGAPEVFNLVPKDITWCAYRSTDLLAGLYLFSLQGFSLMWQNGFTSFTGGPGGGAGDIQSYVWMRNALDLGAAGFIGRPWTYAGFDDDAWTWLPAAAEHAWSMFVPLDPNMINYGYEALNDSYGSF